MEAPPPFLDAEAIERLRQYVGGSDGRSVAAQPPGTRRDPRTLAKAQLKRVIRRGIAWYVDATAKAAAEAAATGVYRMLRTEVAGSVSREEIDVLGINQELLKAELRSVLGSLNDLADAIAPTAGLEGVRPRLSELRERVNSIDRGLRRLAATRAPAADPAPSSPGAALSDAVERFDYLGFERRFRGDSAAILASQRERYLTLLAGDGPVLDIGCGRGEFVGALSDAGIEAIGIDIDAASVDEARALGRNVQRADALETLRAARPGEFGAIVAFQVVEHLQLAFLLELLDRATEVLQPGGVFIAETPNPTSLIVLGTHYILDPTHVRPLHPALLVFLCERAGFRDIDLRYFAPAEQYHLPLLTGDDLPAWAAQINEAFSQLNTVLFGPQDYAVIARTPPSGEGVTGRLRRP